LPVSSVQVPLHLAFVPPPELFENLTMHKKSTFQVSKTEKATNNNYKCYMFLLGRKAQRFY
ncbi:MAG: hypothetical protein J6R60_02860, partial [Clostridia bacterium]|nr:hypothetical protein [Clostridia bacterium]